MERVCLIPARGTSTRLKGKNLAFFGNGENLLTHTINQALGCDIFDRVIVSSDDDKILDISTKIPSVEIHKRHRDHEQLIDVIRDVIPWIYCDINTQEARDEYVMTEEDNDTLGILLVTCPLRTLEDIRIASALFDEAERLRPVVSVAKYSTPAQMAWKVNTIGLLEPVMTEMFTSTRKQDHCDTYHFNDAIIFDTMANFLKPDRDLFGKYPIPYPMPYERSVAIDYQYQLDLARALHMLNNEHS